MWLEYPHGGKRGPRERLRPYHHVGTQQELVIHEPGSKSLPDAESVCSYTELRLLGLQNCEGKKKTFVPKPASL